MRYYILEYLLIGKSKLIMRNMAFNIVNTMKGFRPKFVSLSRLTVDSSIPQQSERLALARLLHFSTEGICEIATLDRYVLSS